jgi:glycosyltransferase involved in cell wall biosynthesis
MPSEDATRVRIAVDAANLARDRRGMGRIARGVIRAALAETSVELTLLIERRADADSARAEFPAARVAPPASARRRGRYDVVWYPFNGMRFPSVAPTLVTMHDAFAFTEAHPEWIARRREQAPIRRAARCATRILTDSEWSRAELARELGLDAGKIHVIHPSPDPFWFPAPGGELPVPLSGARIVLLVGARERRKNARLALEAAALALHAPAELLVVAGELSKRDRAFARKRRIPAGEIAAGDETLRTLYRKAALVLVPSFAEGFGLVAVEAMACGAAVVAGDASALPEATGGAALLLSPQEPRAWAAAIRRLLDDPAELTALRARGAARFAYADRAASAAATLALLAEVARAAAPGRPSN